VKEGDTVSADQPVVEVETDKAVVELPCPKAGVMLRQNFKEGDIVHVGQIAFVIGEKGEKIPDAAPVAPTQQPQRPPVAPVSASPQAAWHPPLPKPTGPLVVQPELAAPWAAAPSSAPTASGGNVLATPATRKYAMDMGVDITKVRGTAAGGRITIDDVKAQASSAKAGASSGGAGGTSQATASTSSAGGVGGGARQFPTEHFEDAGPVEKIKISAIRKAISNKMSRSVYTIPHVTHMEEVDVTWLVQVRERAKVEAAAKGVKLTYLPFIIKAVVGALKEFPQFNARFDEEAGEIVLRKYYNIGIATDTDEGLMVPVIRDAERKDLTTLAMEISLLAEEARKRKLRLEDMRGGTFTITNIGSSGGVWANPIINYPEVAILGVMKMKERPVVVENRIESRKIMNLVLSFDHRVIDGAVAAKFMNAIVKRLEDPTLL
jgi:pyruvate dehydrogenase E2 component (dihydrolipoamide acetyltransferase)